MTETPIDRRHRRRSDRALIILNLATTGLAILAIGATVVLARVEFIQARRSNCELLRGIVQTATPPARRAAGQAFIKSTPLANCNRYAGSFIP